MAKLAAVRYQTGFVFMSARDYEILEKSVGYDGYFRIERYTLRYRRHDGGWSQPVRREIFERGHAVAVIPYDPARDEVILIEQFRAGALEAPGTPWQIEIVAGIVEEGETVADVARREALEEAGCTLSELIPVCEYLVSPGGTSERVALFCGLADTSSAGGLHGLAEEGEDIRAFAVPFEQAMPMVMARPVQVASTLIALQWLALNRDAVRARPHRRDRR